MQAVPSLSEFSLSKTDETILNKLLNKKIISLSECEIAIKEWQKNKSDIIDFLLQSGFITEMIFEDFLNQNWNIQLFQKSYYKNVVDEFLQQEFFPFKEDESEFWVATRRPFEEDEIERIVSFLKTDKSLKLFFLKSSQIEELKFKKLTFKTELENAFFSLNNSYGSKSIFGNNEFLIVKDAAIEFVEILLKQAVSKNLTYIEILPSSAFVSVFFNEYGMRNKIGYFYKEVFLRVLNRVKILFGINVAENEKPQEGFFQTEILTKKLSLKCLIKPSLYGEEVMIEIKEKFKKPEKIESLGFSKNNFKTLNKMLESENGIIIFAGKKDSGKTNTVASCLNFFVGQDSKIATFENFDEFQIPKAVFYNFKPETLKQSNFDVCFLPFTNFAFNLSMQGKKIFMEMEVSDAFSCLQKLKFSGFSNDLISTNIKGIIAQKLIKKLCDCKEEIELGKEELLALRLAKTDVRKIYKAGACEKCNFTGFEGRVLISEVLHIESELEELIFQNASKKAILEVAKKKGFVSFFEEVRLKVLQGITSIDEVKGLI